MSYANTVLKAPISTDVPLRPPELIAAARKAASEVDADGRFPREAFAALRLHGLLSALVPETLGGAGAGLGRVAAQCQALGGACGSAGMVLAMHHIQVACLVRHATTSPWHADFLRRLADRQLLLASSTSEVETGGGMRTSHCALTEDAGTVVLTKRASAMSYGPDADAILVTARANPSAPPGDQVLVVIEREGIILEPTKTWDAMGMRGTGSAAFTLRGRGAREQVVPRPFAEIAAATMVPVSHILWASVWTGIAGDAVMRARAALRARRKLSDAGSSHNQVSPGQISPGAVHLAEAVEILQMAEARVRHSILRFDWDQAIPPNFAEAAADNGLKTSVAEACLTVAQMAMSVCGFEGYARDGEFSVARHLRDLHSAPLMIGNARMRESAARLLLAQKPLIGLE